MDGGPDYTRLCIDCRFMWKNGRETVLCSKMVQKNRSVVDGEVKWRYLGGVGRTGSCEDVRQVGGECGPAGIYWERRS